MKQVILVRQDLNLPKGKLAVQCAHAALSSALKVKKSVLKQWLSDGGKKVILKVENKRELHEFKAICDEQSIECALIQDAGLTTIPPGTVTCLGIGPAQDELIDSITGNLKML